MLSAVLYCLFLTTTADTDVIRAAVILPSNHEFEASLPRVLPVLELASISVQHITGMKFNFFPSDDMCDPDHALSTAVTSKMCPEYSNKLNVIFGPSCEYSVAFVGRLLKFWSIPLVTTGALTYDFRKNKTDPSSEFYHLIRVGHLDFSSMAKFIVKILKKYEWSKVLLLYEKDGCYNLAGKNTCKLMMESLVENLKWSKIRFGAYDLSREMKLPLIETVKREVSTHYSKSNGSLKLNGRVWC